MPYPPVTQLGTPARPPRATPRSRVRRLIRRVLA
jgi:hypothetical protein